MPTPWLADTDLLAVVPSAGILRKSAAERFGDLARWDGISANELRRSRSVVAKAAIAEWQRAVAEELLARHVSGIPVPPAVFNDFAGISPFDYGKGPSLKSLWSRAAGVVVIPIDGRERGSACAHIWLIRRHRASKPANVIAPGWEQLPATCTFGDASFDICTVTSVHFSAPVSGTSWQLGHELLQRAVRAKSKEAIRSLALDWIVTGSLSGEGKVEPVYLGTKLSLLLARNWLFPHDNAKDLRVADRSFTPLKEVRFAASIDSAWNGILNEGSVHLGRAEWPDKCQVMHSLVSEAITPIIAAALLTRPKTIVLWHTTNEERSVSKCADTQSIIKRLLPGTRCDRALISSENIQRAEQQLRAHPTLRKISSQDVLFNVTQGNRLMFFAAHTVARQNPSVCLIYRDFDTLNYDFTLIRYRNDQPETCIIDGRSRANDVPSVNWDQLWIDQRKTNCKELQAKLTGQPCQISGQNAVS